MPRKLTAKQLDKIWSVLQEYDKGQCVGLFHSGLNDGPVYGEDFPVVTGDDFTSEQLVILGQLEVIFALEPGDQR